MLDLKRENCRVAALNLLKTPQMPADCDLLVIAGPAKPFTDSEVEILRQYLEKNGRLFVLVHPRLPPGKLGGLDSLLADYNVDVRDDEIILEPNRNLMGQTVVSSLLVVDAYGRHPITDDVTQMNCVDGPRRAGEGRDAGSAHAIRPAGGAAVRLCRDGADLLRPEQLGGSEPDQAPAQVRPRARREGPALRGRGRPAPREERNLRPAPPAESPEKGARLVVLGSTDVASDIAFTHPEAGYEANRTLVMNCVNWLVNKETKLGIPPQKADRRESDQRPRRVQGDLLHRGHRHAADGRLIGGLVWWVRRK